MGITEKAVLYSRSRFSWKLSEIGAAKPDGARLLREAAATFGWLCVETCPIHLKRGIGRAATFGWLCVETKPLIMSTAKPLWQPPSGGCVLKPNHSAPPAAFQGSHLRVAVC